MFRVSKSRALIAVALSGLAVGSVPSIASAAERHASPTGGGIGCTAALPCSLENALKIAVAGDEVIASPGEYALTDTLEDKANITLRGVPGRPRPRLLFSGPNQQGLRLMHGSLLRDVEIEQAEPVTAVDTSAARLDRVVVKRAGGMSDCAVNLRDALIRNSIVVAGRLPVCSFADGVPDASTYRNVTAVATAGAEAITVVATFGSSTIDLTNVIARGVPGGAGITVVTDIFGKANVTVTHSNFETLNGGNSQVIDGGGNQHDPPKFLDPATGDYRQAPGSVTIDAGINQPVNGAFDVNGDPRRIDTTDIGAHEFVRPVIVATGPATGIGPDTATLTGNVNEIGVPTSYRFEYGPTTAYGSETAAVDLGAEIGQLPVAAEIDGLSPGTTYHFRLAATNRAGAGHGHDRSFTTAPAAPPPPGSTTVFAGVSLVSRTLTLSGKFIRLKLRCPAGTVGGCSGQTKLSARRRTGTRRVALGKARFSLAAGGRATLRVRVSRAGLQRLRGLRRIRATDNNVAHDGAGLSKTTVTKVTVRRRTQER